MNNNNNNSNDSNREKLAEILKLMVKEGDRKEFEYKGYKCLIRRNSYTSFGHLNGYVFVPKGHILYGKHYDEIYEKYNDDIDVHGGITFSDFGHFMGEGSAGDNNAEDYWLIGFDCAHAFDLLPLTYVRFPDHIDRFGNLFESETYRDMDYVTNECKKLVDQIINLVEDKEDKEEEVEKK